MVVPECMVLDSNYCISFYHWGISELTVGLPPGSLKRTAGSTWATTGTSTITSSLWGAQGCFAFISFWPWTLVKLGSRPDHESEKKTRNNIDSRQFMKIPKQQATASTVFSENHGLSFKELLEKRISRLWISPKLHHQPIFSHVDLISRTPVKGPLAVTFVNDPSDVHRKG